MEKLKLFFANWKTTIPAVLASVCATDAVYLKMLPPEWEQHGAAACIFLVSIGLIAAKDADKTHSKVIVQPQPEPVTVPVEGVDMKKVISVVFLALLFVGCSATKGTMLDGTICTLASDGNMSVLQQQIIQSYVDEKDQDKARTYLTTANLGATALCEMLRARQSAVVQGNPVPPVPTISTPQKPS